MIQLAFIGTIVPDKPAFRTVAFNRAGNMVQINLLSALVDAGLSPSMVLSQRPARSFPYSKPPFYYSSKSRLDIGLPLDLLPFINVPIFRPITIGLAVLIKLVWWSRRHPDVREKVVITYNLTEPPGIFTLISARLIGAKAVAAIFDINVPGHTVGATIPRRIDFWLHSKLIPRFDGLIVVNDLVAQDFAPRLPYLRIAGGVSEEVLSYIAQHSNMRPKMDDHFVIVAVGTLNEANGFPEILKAFSLLKGDQYRLRIAGKGPMESLVRRAALADSRIEFLGYLSFREVMSLYMSADALVNMRITKRINTKYFFPSKTMEYLATGVPVLMTDLGFARDDLGRVAFLLKDESPQALAQLVEEVATMDPEKREAKGKAAQDYIRTHNTWKLQGQRVLNFLDTLIDNAKKSPKM